MWDDFVSAMFATFCESALVVHRNASGTPNSPVLLRNIAPITSATWAGHLIDVLAARPHLSDPRLQPFDLLQLSEDSLGRIVLMPQFHSKVNVRALNQLQNPVGMPKPSTHANGVRQRTDDLLAFFAANWDGTYPFAADLQYARDEIQLLHRKRLSLFVEGFTRETPALSDNDAEQFLDYALQQLTVDDCCDDMFWVRCFGKIGRHSLAASNTPPPSKARIFLGHPVLDQVLAEKFDSLGRHLLVRRSPGRPGGSGPGSLPAAPVPTPPWSRFALYLSYFARCNATLISEALTESGVVISYHQVVQTLSQLYYGIIVTL